MIELLAEVPIAATLATMTAPSVTPSKTGLTGLMTAVDFTAIAPRPLLSLSASL